MVRALVFAALLVAVAIGLMLPGPRKAEQPVMASQIPTIALN